MNTINTMWRCAILLSIISVCRAGEAGWRPILPTAQRRYSSGGFRNNYSGSKSDYRNTQTSNEYASTFVKYQFDGDKEILSRGGAFRYGGNSYKNFVSSSYDSNGANNLTYDETGHPIGMNGNSDLFRNRDASTEYHVGNSADRPDDHVKQTPFRSPSDRNFLENHHSGKVDIPQRNNFEYGRQNGNNEEEHYKNYGEGPSDRHIGGDQRPYVRNQYGGSYTPGRPRENDEFRGDVDGNSHGGAGNGYSNNNEYRYGKHLKAPFSGHPHPYDGIKQQAIVENNNYIDAPASKPHPYHDKPTATPYYQQIDPQPVDGPYHPPGEQQHHRPYPSTPAPPTESPSRYPPNTDGPRPAPEPYGPVKGPTQNAAPVHHQPYHPPPSNSIANYGDYQQEHRESPSEIFFRKLMKIIRNTLFYGDMEFKKNFKRFTRATLQQHER